MISFVFQNACRTVMFIIECFEGHSEKSRDEVEGNNMIYVLEHETKWKARWNIPESDRIWKAL